MNKKSFSFLTFCATIVLSQAGHAQVNSSIKYYSYGDPSNPRTVISPAPGVYIQPSAWAASRYQSNNPATANSNLPPASTNSVADKPSVAEKNSIQSQIDKGNAILAAQVPAAPVATEEKTVAPVAQKTQGQIPMVNKDIYTNKISTWNKTSQQSIETAAAEKLSAQYQAFLEKNK